ncbi:MAG: DUF3307 domain-containing protein [Candidatus Scalindua sp.]|jgi:hypothetical protein|nr:DUF3307 domain-containing protein [Candidatus Scalindua sp.]
MLTTTFTVHIILVVLLVHWVADFLFQTQEMASKKHEHWGILILHCVVYATVLTAFIMLAPSLGTIITISLGNAALCWSLLFMSHLWIDAVTSRIVKKSICFKQN